MTNEERMQREANLIATIRATVFMWSLNSASSNYAEKFGAYPSDIGALKTPSQPTPPNCATAGLLEHPFDEGKLGYRIEYKAGPLSEKATGGVPGQRPSRLPLAPLC
jgi:hypothetical protein